MSIKRSAKISDFKNALATLESKYGGIVEGTPGSIPKKLGYDGSWAEFMAFSGAEIRKTDVVGRYVVKHGREELDNRAVMADTPQYNPEIFAMCASAYLLGEGDPAEFEPLDTTYEERDLVLEALAREIDPAIGAIHIPYDTAKQPIELYRIERSLVASADGNGRFIVDGRTR